MLKEGEIYFNNNVSLNLNLYLENYPSIPIANEEYEEIPIEGMKKYRLKVGVEI